MLSLICGVEIEICALGVRCVDTTPNSKLHKGDHAVLCKVMKLKSLQRIVGVVLANVPEMCYNVRNK